MPTQSARFNAALAHLREAKPSPFDRGLALTGNQVRDLMEAELLPRDARGGLSGTGATNGWLAEMARRNPGMSVVLWVQPNPDELTAEGLSAAQIKILGIDGTVEPDVFVEEVLPLYGTADEQEAWWCSGVVEFYCRWD